MSEGKKTITVRVPADVHKDARLVSVERGESLSALIVEWLRLYVKRYKEGA